MDFLVREGIFPMFLFLSLGVFGDVIQPFIQNRVVVTGTGNAAFTCSYTQLLDFFDWSMRPVGGDHVIKGGAVLHEPHNFEWRFDGQESSMIVRNPSVSTAGVYTCEENSRHSAQLIVIVDEPACKYLTQENEKTPCEQISDLSCTVRYAANDSYVVPNMTWSTIGSSSESLDSSIKTSTFANITTAVSKLKLTSPENYKSLSKFRCSTSFSLKNNLPSEFATNRPDYNKECSPNADACTDEKHGKDPDKTPDYKSKPSAPTSGITTPSEYPGFIRFFVMSTKQSEKPDDTTKLIGKPFNSVVAKTGDGGDNSKPSGGGQAMAIEEPCIKSVKSAVGLSIGSSQRNIVTCVIGVAGLFLVDL